LLKLYLRQQYFNLIKLKRKKYNW